MTEDQTNRIKQQVDAIIIDMQAIQLRLDILLGVLADDSNHDEQAKLDEWE